MGSQVAKLFGKLILISIPFIAYYIGYNSYLFYTGNFKSDASLIFESVKKSKQKSKQKKVVFGDSVGGQLYPSSSNFDSLGLLSLTTSDPSSLAGIYVLLKNVVNENKPKEMVFYYVVHPSSLSNELDGKYTYNHFLKPFYTIENYKLFTSQTHQAAKKFPYWYACQLPFIKISNWQPDVKESKPKKKGRYISNIYLEYLKLIKEDANKRGYKFKAVAPILRESLQATDYTLLKKQIDDNQLTELFEGYFDNMKYLPNAQFHTNSNHYLKATTASIGANPLNF
jgi:hypothetical protein